jgi:hypothetical protein
VIKQDEEMTHKTLIICLIILSAGFVEEDL